MNVLVTGGAGFIGSHTVDKLVELGHDVTVIDNLERQVHPNGRPDYLNQRVAYVFRDIRDSGMSLEGMCENMDVVFHFASVVGVEQSMDPEFMRKYVDVNCTGTARLLAGAVASCVKKFIVASSMSVYGEGSYHLHHKDTPIGTKETKRLEPASVYAITKESQEKMCQVAGLTYGMPTVALRYFNVYGPRQSLNNPYTGLCAIFSRRIKEGNPPIIYGDGKQTRDFISVHDVVRANILAMENSAMDNRFFNVGTGMPTTVLKIARKLIRLHGSKLKPKIVNRFRKGDVRHCFADVSRIKKEIGFKPEVKLDDGLREFVEWSKGESKIRVKDLQKAVKKIKDEDMTHDLISPKFRRKDLK